MGQGFQADRFQKLFPSKSFIRDFKSESREKDDSKISEKPVSDKMMERLRVVIMGGGRVGTLLAGLLRAEKHQVTLIEINRERIDGHK